MGSMAIEDGGISVFNLSWVVHDDDLSEESFSFSGRVTLEVTANVSSLDVLDGETFYVESNVVSGNSFRDGLVMHLN
jgi:hypothetical protein